VRRVDRLVAVYRGVAVILVFWLIDAWIQAATGWSLGGPAEAERLSGIFGAGNLKLGPALASLSAFLLWIARERWGRRGLAVAVVVLLGPILLAGSRASWLVFGLVVLAFVWRDTRRPLPFVLAGLAALLLGVAAAGLAWRESGAFQARVQRTLLVLRGSPQDLDEALAGRLRIWTTSAAMIAAHPANGVGVRGFRNAYAAYAGPGDAFIADDGTGAAHAHQLVLEILTETGVIGLALWLIAAAAAIRAWWRASGAARERAFAPAVALAATCFPLNTHLAFYSAWWGLLVWWLVGLYCAALYADRVEGGSDAA